MEIKRILGVDGRLTLFSVAAGGVDAFSLMRLKETFTSAMSGNTVLLGLDIAQQHFVAAGRATTSLAAFIMGLAVAGFPMARYGTKKEWTKVVTFVTGLELLVLLIFAGIFYADIKPLELELFVMVALASFSMGLQSSIAYHMSIPGITTTYFTGTLNSIVNGTALDLVNPEEAPDTRRTLFQIVIFVAYLLSALAAAMLVVYLPAEAVLFPVAAVAAVLASALLIGGPAGRQ